MHGTDQGAPGLKETRLPARRCFRNECPWCPGPQPRPAPTWAGARPPQLWAENPSCHAESVFIRSLTSGAPQPGHPQECEGRAHFACPPALKAKDTNSPRHRMSKAATSPAPCPLLAPLCPDPPRCQADSMAVAQPWCPGPQTPAAGDGHGVSWPGAICPARRPSAEGPATLSLFWLSPQPSHMGSS